MTNPDQLFPENPDDLKAIDDLLPPDLVAIIEHNREFCKAFFQRTFSGIPDVAYRNLN